MVQSVATIKFGQSTREQREALAKSILSPMAGMHFGTHIGFGIEKWKHMTGVHVFGMTQACQYLADLFDGHAPLCIPHKGEELIEVARLKLREKSGCAQVTDALFAMIVAIQSAPAEPECKMEEERQQCIECMHKQDRIVRAENFASELSNERLALDIECRKRKRENDELTAKLERAESDLCMARARIAELERSVHIHQSTTSTAAPGKHIPRSPYKHLRALTALQRNGIAEHLTDAVSRTDFGGAIGYPFSVWSSYQGVSDASYPTICRYVENLCTNQKERELPIASVVDALGGKCDALVQYLCTL